MMPSKAETEKALQEVVKEWDQIQERVLSELLTEDQRAKLNQISAKVKKSLGLSNADILDLPNELRFLYKGELRRQSEAAGIPFTWADRTILKQFAAALRQRCPEASPIADEIERDTRELEG